MWLDNFIINSRRFLLQFLDQPSSQMRIKGYLEQQRAPFSTFMGLYNTCQKLQQFKGECTCLALPFRSGVNGSHWTPLGLSFSTTSHSCPPQSHPPHCRADQAAVLVATLLVLRIQSYTPKLRLNRALHLFPSLPCHCTTTYTLCSSTLAFCHCLEHIKLSPTCEPLHSLFSPADLFPLSWAHLH